MQGKAYARLVRATAFHAPRWGEVETLEDVIFLLDHDGVIVDIIARETLSQEEYAHLQAQTEVVDECQAGSYLLPGFIDLHIHAAQWPNAGKALHVPLKEWLDTYTFPLESSLAEEETARKIYRDLVETTLQHGTTTAVYLGTQSLSSSLCLADVCLDVGQRGCIGKVAMDNESECPSFYRDASAQQAIDETEQLIDELQVRGEKMQGVLPVVTPRFTPACSEATLRGLGEIAQQKGVIVQTHIAESNWEAGHAHARFGQSDAAALAEFGLLTPRSVLAHGTCLTDEDAHILAAYGATVAHCPISNVFFGNAVYPARKRFAQGVNVGLGTDISGGFSPSMFDNIRQAIMASRLLEDGVNAALSPAERGVPDSRIDYRHALYMATRGGAQALGLPLGVWQKGMIFDAQVIDTMAPRSAIRVMDGHDTLEDVLQKILFLATVVNVSAVYVRGKKHAWREEVNDGTRRV